MPDPEENEREAVARLVLSGFHTPEQVLFLENEAALPWRNALDSAGAILAARRLSESEIRREAWDEGYMAVPAEPEDREFFVEDAPNPYRKVDN